MEKSRDDLVKSLSIKAINLMGGSFQEIERYCWMVAHEHMHGVMPSEYDIREIDESLYLDVLSLTKYRLNK